MRPTNPPTKGGGRSPKRKWVKWLKRFFWGATATLLAGFIGLGAYVWLVFNSLESRVALLPKKQAQLSLPPTEILSADGVVLCRLANERREPVSYPNIPKRVVDATIAAEDKRFWEHSGVDLSAIIRAVWINLRSGSVRQGGSTITQQVAKRLLTSGDRTFRRKVEDACLALQIERQYTKEQIIELYMNEVYYGSQAYGIKAAAAVYFGKPLDKLTLGQAALLARLPRRPSDDNPYVDPEAAKRNRNVVLGIMLEEGMISKAEHDAAEAEPVKLAAPQPVRQIGIRLAPYFVTWVLDQLRHTFPDEEYARGGYRIYTTLNLAAQKSAEDALHSTIRRYRNRRVTEGAIIIMRTDGQVMAMVGGSDFQRSQYNIITQGRRQPGSSFKPFVYSTALDMGVITPNSQISNERFVIRDRRTGRTIWSPEGGGTGGTVSLRSAITRSINTPAVHVCADVGPANVVRFAHDVFGFESELFPGPALALGASGVRPIEMARAYSVFATHGNRVEPYGIRRVVGPDGAIVGDYRPRIHVNVLSRSTVEPMRSILRAVVTSGTGRAAASVTNASGKTGTTNSFKDAWFCGYTEQLVAIAWVANATYNPKSTPPYSYGEMDHIFGGQVSAAMWASAVKPVQQIIGEERAHDGSWQEEDTGDVTLRVCSESGLRATPNCPSTESRKMSRDEARGLARCSLHAAPSPSVPDERPAPGPGETTPDLPPPVPSDPPPVAAKPVSDTIKVEVCVDTGLRATTYCRLKRVQSYKRGTEPTDYCHVHRP
jgi:penicillin-binding protein 1A